MRFIATLYAYSASVFARSAAYVLDGVGGGVTQVLGALQLAVAVEERVERGVRTRHVQVPVPFLVTEATPAIPTDMQEAATPIPERVWSAVFARVLPTCVDGRRVHLTAVGTDVARNAVTGVAEGLALRVGDELARIKILVSRKAAAVLGRLVNGARRLMERRIVFLDDDFACLLVQAARRQQQTELVDDRLCRGSVCRLPVEVAVVSLLCPWRRVRVVRVDVTVVYAEATPPARKPIEDKGRDAVHQADHKRERRQRRLGREEVHLLHGAVWLEVLRVEIEHAGRIVGTLPDHHLQIFTSNEEYFAIVVRHELHCSHQRKDAHQWLADLAMRWVGVEHEGARLAVEQDGSHCGADIAVVAAVRATTVPSGAEGRGGRGDVTRAGVGCDQALNQALGDKGGNIWVVEE
eukprot:1558443-Prymnesium_polylepis.2